MGLRNRHLLKDENCFFVTTTCTEWKSLIDLSNAYLLIEQSLAFVSKKYDTSILGYVIMPNHIHLILYFKLDNRLSDFMRDFKKFTSVKIRQELDIKGQKDIIESLRISKPNRVFRVWMDRFDDVYLRDPELLEIKLNYIHLNPLQEKWNLAKVPEAYLYSSAKFYFKGEQPGLEITDYREYCG